MQVDSPVQQTKGAARDQRRAQNKALEAGKGDLEKKKVSRRRLLFTTERRRLMILGIVFRF
jgi:hypothetical protein